MSVITAYKCDEDGRIFEDKAKYLLHLRKLAAAKSAQRKKEKLMKEEQEWWYANFWNKVKSIPQLQVAILHHADVIAENGFKHYRYGSLRKPSRIHHIVEFKKFDLHHSNKVSNTHSKPVNGVSNWGGDVVLPDGTPAPRGYPGWEGNFSYSVTSTRNSNISYCGSYCWENTRIHTGTGGGHGFVPTNGSKTEGVESYYYSFRLYEDDWPGMKAAYDEAREERDKRRFEFIMKNTTDVGFKFDLDEWVNAKYPAEEYFV